MLHVRRGESKPWPAQVGDGVFEVLSTSGDTHLGGDDFDKRIVDFLAEDFQRGEGIDLRKDRQALQRLMEASEKAKMELSTLSQARGCCPGACRRKALRACRACSARCLFLECQVSQSRWQHEVPAF